MKRRGVHVALVVVRARHLPNPRPKLVGQDSSTRFQIPFFRQNRRVTPSWRTHHVPFVWTQLLFRTSSCATLCPTNIDHRHTHTPSKETWKDSFLTCKYLCTCLIRMQEKDGWKPSRGRTIHNVRTRDRNARGEEIQTPPLDTFGFSKVGSIYEPPPSQSISMRSPSTRTCS